MVFGAYSRSRSPLRRACLIALLATIASCGSGWAQSVRGIVLDRLTGMAVAGARVVLEMDGRTRASTATDESGAFVLSAPDGEYQLRVDHVGYDEVVQRVAVPDSVRLTIGLTPHPIVLGSLRATTRVRVPNLDRVGFYRRQDLGFGYFIDRNQIERVAGGRILEVLRGLPGVRVVPVLDGSGDHDIKMRDGCLASIIVDWHVVRRGGAGSWSGGLDALPHPDLIQAIEVYPGPTGVPVRVRSGIGACGAILIWTKH